MSKLIECVEHRWACTRCGEQLKPEKFEVEQISEHKNDLARLWNDTVKNLPKVSKITPQRAAKIKARSKDRSFEEWEHLFEGMDQTPFLCGKNDRGWRADFDWIMRNPENALRVIEGKYSGTKPPASSGLSALATLRQKEGRA